LKYKITKNMMTHNIATTMNPETHFDIEHEQYIETPWSIIES